MPGCMRGDQNWLEHCLLRCKPKSKSLRLFQLEKAALYPLWLVYAHARNALAISLMLLVCIGTAIALQREGLQSRDQVPSESSQPPAHRVPVGNLGFLPPGEIYALMRTSYATLDFMDSEHLLFTFHRTQLLPRLMDSTPKDDDQMIHAVVVEISSGKVLSEADWRMRDRGRYLWPLGDGRFLVRIRSRLYLIDQSLKLRPYLDFPGEIKSIQVGLTGHFLLVESQESRINLNIGELPGSSEPNNQDQVPDQTRGQLNGADPESSGAGYVLRIIRTDIKKQVAVAHMQSLPYIPLMKDSYIYILRGKSGQWLLGLRKLQTGEKTEIGSIESTCMPAVRPLSDQILMAVACSGSSADHIGIGLSLDGKHLWERRWSGRRIWPSFASSQDGSRFVYETMLMDHEISTMAAADPESVMGQIVEVYDTVSGRLQLIAPANPILDAGQNFALTSDGKRLAVLNNNAIEIFDLPSADASSDTVSKGK